MISDISVINKYAYCVGYVGQISFVTIFYDILLQ